MEGSRTKCSEYVVNFNYLLKAYKLKNLVQ